MNQNLRRRPSPSKICRALPYSELESRRLLAFTAGTMAELVLGTPSDDSIVIQLDPNDFNMVQIEINGVLSEQIDINTTDQIILSTLEGNDEVQLNYANGDPTPSLGFVIDGGLGSDSLFVSTEENVEFRIDGLDADSPVEDLTNQIDGVFALLTSTGTPLPEDEVICSQFLDLEALNSSGTGNDLFLIPDAESISSYTGDFLIDAGTGSNQTRIIQSASNGLELDIQSDSIDGLTDGSFYFRSSGGSYSLDPAVNLTNIFAGIEIVGSNLGSDEFTIGSFFEENSLAIHGRDGNDQFNVGDANSELINGEVLLGGNTGNDSFNLLFRDVVSTQIGVFGGTGSDFAAAFGHFGEDQIDLTPSGINYSTPTGHPSGVPIQSDYRLEFLSNLRIWTLAGDDLVTITGSNAENNFIATHSGDDVIDVLDTTAFQDYEIWTGTSDDQNEITIYQSSPTSEISFVGDDGNDQFDVKAESRAQLNLRSPDYVGLDGIGSSSRKTVLSGQLNNINLFGASGSTHYQLNRISYVINEETIIISNDSTTFETTVDSTNGNGISHDLFEINSAENGPLNLYGREGSDTYRIASGTSLFTQDINVFDEAGTNTIRFARSPNQPVNAIVLENEVLGYTLGKFEYSGDGSSSIGTFKIQLNGSDGNDTFIGGTTINGFGGDDIININSPTFDLLQGGSGNDTYNIPTIPTSEDSNPRIIDSAPDGHDTINFNLGSGRYYITEDGIGLFNEFETDFQIRARNSVLNFATGAENDKIIFTGSPSETLNIETNEGDDLIRVAGNRGLSDVTIVGGDGNDFFDFNFSNDVAIEAFGSSGNDFFDIGRIAGGDLRLDGGQGNDTKEIYLSGAEKQIDARDSGNEGSDSTRIIGSFFDDEFILQEDQILFLANEVLVDGNTEQLSLFTSEGDDRVTIHNPHAQMIEVITVDGDDFVLIEDHANDLVVRTSGGSDQIVVQSTQAGSSTYLRTGAGDDTFRFGTASTGNLSNIRGEVTIFGGGHSVIGDRVLLNDQNATGSFGYHVSPTRIEALDGPGIVSRPEFAGINLSGKIELIRLSATRQSNHFEAVASELTRYTLIGGEPASPSFLVDSLTVFVDEENITNLVLSDPISGNGYFQFDDDKQTVQFFGIEDRQIDET